VGNYIQSLTVSTPQVVANRQVSSPLYPRRKEIPSTLAEIHSLKKSDNSLRSFSTRNDDDLVMDSVVEGSWKEIEQLQLLHQQQSQNQPSQILDRSGAHPLSTFDFQSTNYRSPARSPYASPMTTTHNIHHPMNITRDFTYHSPLQRQFQQQSSPTNTLNAPEWQEYHLSPAMTTKGDSFSSHLSPPTDSHMRSSAKDLQPMKSHDLRCLSVQEALGTTKDLPDEWIESLKQIIGRHLRAQLKM